MLFGDNLLDFTDPKKSTAKEREKLVQKHEKRFWQKVYYFPKSNVWKLGIDTLS